MILVVKETIPSLCSENIFLIISVIYLLTLYTYPHVLPATIFNSSNKPVNSFIEYIFTTESGRFQQTQNLQNQVNQESDTIYGLVDAKRVVVDSATDENSCKVLSNSQIININAQNERNLKFSNLLDTTSILNINTSNTSNPASLRDYSYIRNLEIINIRNLSRPGSINLLRTQTISHQIIVDERLKNGPTQSSLPECRVYDPFNAFRSDKFDFEPVSYITPSSLSWTVPAHWS